MRKKIKDIADIQIGYPFRKKIEPLSEGTYRVIQLKDFDENRNLKLDSLTHVSITGKVEKYMVNKNDVLFLSRGHNNYAFSVDHSLDNTVAASYFFILRLKTEMMLPEYLAWYIDQPIAKKYINNIARRGTHMPLVPLSEFKNLKIDIPDIETQKRIIELNRLFDRESKLLNKILEKRSLLIRGISINSAKNAMK